MRSPLTVEVSAPATGRKMVFMIFRPLACIAALARFSPVSREFIFCHWALLICDNDCSVETIRTWIANLNLGTEMQPGIVVGYLLQLVRTGINTELNTTLCTTEKLRADFPDCSIAYVGTTDLKPGEIVIRGTCSSRGGRVADGADTRA
jgi:hypothetical protein